MSNRVANGLVAAGMRPGDRVALYGPNCWEWLVAYYGIAKTPQRLGEEAQRFGLASAVAEAPPDRERLLELRDRCIVAVGNRAGVL